MFDTHTHLHEETFDDTREEILSDLKKRDIRGILVGTDLDTSRQAVELARNSNLFWSTVGIHPHEAQETDPQAVIENLAVWLDERRVVGIGECGLDYAGSPSEIERTNQQNLFAAQLELASTYDLPMVVHTRDAWEDTYDILKSFQHSRVILHCFTGDANWAQRFLSEFPNLYISFSGIVTFKKKAEDIQQAARTVPAERMLAETDSPYLAPEPYRGKRNDTRNIERVIACLARLREQEFSEVDAQLDANARAAFGLE